MGLRVKAKALADDQKIVGYYDHLRRRPGEEFEIEKVEHFSYFWMEPVGWKPPELDANQLAAAQAAYSRRLHALANGADTAAAQRAEDLRFAQERDAIRKASPGDAGTQPPRRG